MQNLHGRLAALDSTAGAALDVIAYFDELARSRAGLEQVVRGAAVLAHVPARLADPARRILVRVDVEGVRTELVPPPAPGWRSLPVGSDGAARLWLETDRQGWLVDDMVLERAAILADQVIVRVRGRGAAEPDGAAVEIVVDPVADPRQRRAAARVLGLEPGRPARVVALPGGDVVVLPSDRALPTGSRLGVGGAEPVDDLPRSAAAARTALRFTAEGTSDDPGPRVVHAEELGGLALLATAVDAGAPPTADCRALVAATQEIPHLARTLVHYADAAGVRAAAKALVVHHSTMQERLEQAGRRLGWDVRDAAGRLRLQLVLAEHRLRHGGAGPSSAR